MRLTQRPCCATPPRLAVDDVEDAMPLRLVIPPASTAPKTIPQEGERCQTPPSFDPESPDLGFPPERHEAEDERYNDDAS